MIANLTPYPAYKDSGVPWLGKVPSHWTRLPGRACYREKKVPNKGLTETTVLSLSYGHIVVKPPEKLHGLVPASFETYQIVEPGDIIVRPTDLQNDWTSLRFGLSRNRGVITSAYMCLHTEKVVLRPYGHLLLHTYDLKKIFYGMGSGLRQNLDWRDFKYLPCIVPPLPEQTAIARFLDLADRRIRRCLRAKQRLIELLEEQKQAVIHEAVTGRVDVRTEQPYPAYKPSGVEWLGAVPAHWEVRPGRSCFYEKKQLNVGLQEQTVLSLSYGQIVIKPRESLHGLVPLSFETYQIVDPMDIVIRPTDLQNDRKSLRFGLSKHRGIITAAYLCFHAINRIEASYGYLLLHAYDLLKVFYGLGSGLRQNLGWVDFKSLPCCVPPLAEQAAIAQYLDRTDRRIRRCIQSAQRKIELLNEYRTRLIADVVTGKLDVRVTGKLDVREAAVALPATDPLAAGLTTVPE